MVINFIRTDDHYHEPLYTLHSHFRQAVAAAAVSGAAAAAAVDRFALNLFGMLTNVFKMGAQHCYMESPVAVLIQCFIVFFRVFGKALTGFPFAL